MNFEIYRFGKRVDLSKYEFKSIEIAFIKIFKNMLLDDKKVSEEFYMYANQYHSNYEWLNRGANPFSTVLLEVGSRELQLLSGNICGLDYNYEDSIFFSKMVSDFLIRAKGFGVIKKDCEKVITSAEYYRMYFGQFLDQGYNLVRIAPIVRKRKKDNTKDLTFVRKNYSYDSKNFIYDPQDMCSYLGDYSDNIKIMKKIKKDQLI